MLPDDLPQDLPTLITRFGTDEACRDYLFRQRWPSGLRCRACGHGEAWALARRNIYECAACGQQRSLLKGTILEQTKTGLAKWFLAIYLVTSSKGGIAATELQRQMGFGQLSDGLESAAQIPQGHDPAWPTAAQRAGGGGRETYLGGAKPGRPGRGAAGKTLVAGAVEAGRGKARGRRLGRLRLARLPDAGATSLGGSLAANVAKPAAVATDGWTGYAGLTAEGYRHEPVNLSASWGDAALRLPAIHLVLGLAKRWLLGSHRRWNRRSDPAGNGLAAARPWDGAVGKKHLPEPISTSTSSASTAAPPRRSATVSRG